MPKGGRGRGRGRGRIKNTVIVANVDVDAPAAPTNLVDTARTATTITLGWDANSEDDLAGYRVYNSLDGINFGPVITLTSTPAYIVTVDLNNDPLTASTLYYSYVTAIDNSNNESDPSNIDLTTTSALGTGFDVYPIQDGGIFEGQEANIPNASATWTVTAQAPLDGSFSDFGDGGSYKYTRGALTGNATFTFDVLDYDGLGGDLLNNIFTVTVL